MEVSYTSILSLIMMLFSTAFCFAAASRIAVVCAPADNEQFQKGGLKLGGLGWPEDDYTDMQISELTANLSKYHVVAILGVYHHVNPREFIPYAKEWRTYVENGGCLVVADANDPAHLEWFQAIDARLQWSCKEQKNPHSGEPPAWIARDHPLMRGNLIWSVPVNCPTAWSQSLTTLIADPAGKPLLVYREIGNGALFISSAFSYHGWPSIEFIQALPAWLADPERLSQESRLPSNTGIASLSIPELDSLPIMDGTIGESEWPVDAVSFPYTLDNKPALQQTECRVARTKHDLLFAFTCYDTDLPKAVDFIKADSAGLWATDCVEVFLQPFGTGTEVYHFMVNVNGAMYQEKTGDTSWDAYWSAATLRQSNKWCVEMRIPFVSLGLTTAIPPCGEMRANFNRRYQTRRGQAAQVSGWSFAPNGFDKPDAFGRLTGIAASNSSDVSTAEISLSPPTTWIVGDNTVKAQFRQSGGESLTLEIVCVDRKTDRILGTSKTIRCRPNSMQEISLKVELGREGSYSLQLLLRDARQENRIFASSRQIHAVVPPLLVTKLLSPCYRNSIQSRDPWKGIWLQGVVTGKLSSEAVVKVSLVDGATLAPVWMKQKRIGRRKTIEVKKAAVELQAGAYRLTIDIEDHDTRVYSYQRPIHVLPPADTEITFDHKRICYLNGRPIFPIGLYHVHNEAVEFINTRAAELGLPEISIEEAFQSVKAHGFNFTVGGYITDERVMQSAHDAGLYIVPWSGSPTADELQSWVTTAKRYPHIFFWYGIDEPMGIMQQWARDAYERYQQLDHHRPVSAACFKPNHFPLVAEFFDFIMMDPYCIRHTPLKTISEWVAAGLKATDGMLPVWVVPQAFAIDGSIEEPTNEELRCQAYLSIIGGATGLCWYAYTTYEPWARNPKGRNQWFLPDSHLWDYFTQLNAEIEQVSPILLHGNSLGPAQCDTDAIHSNIWEYKKKQYLIAANHTDKPVSGVFTQLTGGTARVLFEARDIVLQRNTLQDTFKPLEVHIYELIHAK